jgi:hypothetical protein
MHAVVSSNSIIAYQRPPASYSGKMTPSNFPVSTSLDCWFVQLKEAKIAVRLFSSLLKDKSIPPVI